MWVQEVNLLAEHLKEQLTKPPVRLERRESVSKLFEQSETFGAFRNGKEGEQQVEGEDAEGSLTSKKNSITKNDGEHRRSDSARQWDADSGMRAEAALNAFLQEQGGGREISQSFASVEEGNKQQQGESMGGAQVQGEQSMHQYSADTGASGEEYDEEDVDYTSWALLQEESSTSPGFGGPSALDSFTVDRDTVLKKRVLGGTVSTYKHKQELRNALERRAGLKYIAERRAEVRARNALAKDAEEKVSIAQGHVDECETKIAKLRDEAELLHEADPFGNRDRCKALQGRVVALRGKMHEAQGELAREAEIEYVARSEYNNAEIELRKVEELEPELIMEEDLANAEQRVLAHVRADKEREAAMRLEKMRQKRAQAGAQQHYNDEQKTLEAASIAKSGRVAAIRRVKEARSKQGEALRHFEGARHSERHQRAGALVSLKGNMEAAADKIRGGNERQYKKMRAVEASRNAEKADILAAGGNPYAVWRQQEQAKKADVAKREREEKMKDMENKLLHQLMEEEARRKDKEELEKEHKVLIKEFQAQMGGAAKQKATAQYMRERTVGGKEVLDPTGREARIYPSKATVLMDWKFGLGRKAYPEGAMPGQELPPGMPEGYDQNGDDGVEDEGWRATQKDRLITKMSRKFPHDSHNETLVGSKYLDDSMRRTAKNTKSQKQMEEEAAMVAMLDAHEATRHTASDDHDHEPANADNEGNEGQGLTERLPEATMARMNEVFAVPEFQGIWDGDAGADSRQASKYQGTLSALEQQYLKAAMDRKKAGYGWIEKQVVWGKEFKGTAFVASEKGKDIAAIEFKDIVPGHVYKRKITLTNASYSFNTFKVLELPDTVKDFFSISYSHPGALSPGMTCDMHIKFEPKLNQDILEQLPLLCQTGAQHISLRCLTKKVTVSTTTPEVELSVIMGESITRHIVLVNKGCLDSTFRVFQLHAPPRQDHIEHDLAAAEFSGGHVPEDAREPTLVFDVEGVAVGYSTTRIAVTFTPTAPLAMEIPVHIVFEKGLSEPQSPDLFVMLRARAYEVPIYLEDSLMDLRCCCYGMAYTQTLVVRNRGKVALKALPLVPPHLRGFAKFTPDMAYVQARDHHGHDGLFAFRLRFTPQPSLLHKCAEFLETGLTGKPDTLALPVQVGVPDQVLPVYFTLRAQLTTADLELSRKEIAFGECGVSDAVMVRETVTNLSELPVRIGFVRLPRGLSISPPLGLYVAALSLSLALSRSLSLSLAEFCSLSLSLALSRSLSLSLDLSRSLSPSLAFSLPRSLSCSLALALALLLSLSLSLALS